MHAIAHTHWDREWYHPAQRFQARLVALVDALLDGPADAATPFLLDGQTIVLADYLAIRPERALEVSHALAGGALEAGPWYVLADNLIPSGEAIIRNLEAGRRWLRRMGASAPRVAYCPDTFGHPAAMPLVAAGFGCEVAIVWRGFGGASFPASDTVWWDGPDGSRLLLYHLPPDGYEFGSGLPGGAADAAARWRRAASTLRARNVTGCVLLTVGADHHAAPPDLPRALALLDAAARDDGGRVQRSGLAQAAGALLHSARQHEGRGHALPSVAGELRDSYGYTWTLQGTFATRAHQKRDNARLERALLRDVEPWTALAWLHAPPAMRRVAADGSLTLAQVPALLHHAWETLLRTHPHDTLCGCSVDDVALAMTARQRRVAALVPELRDAALACALGHDRVAARARPVREAPLTVVRNRAARARGGVAELRLVETLSDVRVGPGSGDPAALGAAVAGGAGDATFTPRVPMVGGCEVQLLSSHVTHQRRESPQHYPDDDLVRVHRAVAWVPEVPASGVRVFDAAGDATRSRSAGRSPMPAPVTIREHGGHVTLDNGIIRVTASHDGVTVAHGSRVLGERPAPRDRARCRRQLHAVVARRARVAAGAVGASARAGAASGERAPVLGMAIGTRTPAGVDRDHRGRRCLARAVRCARLERAARSPAATVLAHRRGGIASDGRCRVRSGAPCADCVRTGRAAVRAAAVHHAAASLAVRAR